MKLIMVFFLTVPLICHAHADCWEFTAKRFNVEVRLLQAIAQVESGMDPASIGKNRNGTRDYGLMQINSMHLNRLSKKGISESMLINDPCVSLLVGASILKDMVNIYGYGWEAVGAYNAGVAKGRYSRRMAYARKVWKIYQRPLSERPDILLQESHRRIKI